MASVRTDRSLSELETAAMAQELDAIRESVLSDLGEADARYIRKTVAAVRWLGALGRGLLFAGVFPPAFVLGTILLGLSKILENMEVAHNVMHGQYDWMGDPALRGHSYEWDIAGTSDNWRKTHNFQHHTFTNVHGMDDDLGYGLLRLFPEQRWRPYNLIQPLVAVVFAILFEWGIAIQDLEIGRYFAGRKTGAELAHEARPVLRKIGVQVLRDYLFFPLLAGPFFLTVLAGNAIANVIRNIWTYVVIFCGHFTAQAATFPKSVVGTESRGDWYLRQLRGSSNISGGPWLHYWTGNLSHQIEHHLFPDLPARRYAEIAPRVREICERYGQVYNTGSFARQFGQVVWRILRYSFPNDLRGRNRLQAARV